MAGSAHNRHLYEGAGTDTVRGQICGVWQVTVERMTLATATVYVGLAVTSVDVTQAATGVFDNVVVRPPVAEPTADGVADGAGQWGDVHRAGDHHHERDGE